MATIEEIQEAKDFISNEGYGRGSNFTVNTVANLMAEWAEKKAKCGCGGAVEIVCSDCVEDRIINNLEG